MQGAQGQCFNKRWVTNKRRVPIKRPSSRPMV